MLKTFLTRAVEFPAGHRYIRTDWSDKVNLARFGRCYRAPAHGHNYRIEVTVEGEPNPETGMAMDLAELDRLLHDQVVEPMDHAFLNDLPEFRGGRIPTTENLAHVVWNRIECRLPGHVCLRRVRVQEDRDLWAECTAG
ncbi:MAG: 6-carboxytetrahydropterin synthase [Gemmatimonadota bacterium]|nr:6-carboxytetrahydropterin synthase [Gemmatimonadota bacterium]